MKVQAHYFAVLFLAVAALMPAATNGAETEQHTATANCHSASGDESSCLKRGNDSEDADLTNTDELNLCVGIRGNGNWIYSHFPSLARIVEEVGTIDGAAGGSSASVTTYILESVQSNPLIVANNPALCDQERRARTSFLLKSVESIDERLNIANPFTEKGEEAIQFLRESEILERLAQGGQRAKDAVEELVLYLGSTLLAIGNPEFFQLVQELAYDPDLQAAIVADIVTDVLSPLAAVDSPSYFIRPIPFSMAAASPIHDTIGSFYAGYKPVDLDGFEYMLSQCASPTMGMSWDDAEAVLAENGKSCGNLFAELVTSFMESRDDTFPSRLDAPVGTDSQTSLISVAVIRDSGIDVYNEAKRNYVQGNLNLTWDMNFNDIRFGYWGEKAALDRAEAAIAAFDDLKSEKADFIGQTTWRDMLTRSPGEPGLSNGIEGTDASGEAFVSIGGWPDLTPTQVLKAAGCEHVVLVSRHVGVGDFQFSVESMLGATEEQLALLNDLDSPSSSWSSALALSNGALCADYIDEVDGTVDKIDLTRIGWAGPFVTDDECLIDLVEDAPDMLPLARYRYACHHGAEVNPDILAAGDDTASVSSHENTTSSSGIAKNRRSRTALIAVTALLSAASYSRLFEY